MALVHLSDPDGALRLVHTSAFNGLTLDHPITTPARATGEWPDVWERVENAEESEIANDDLSYAGLKRRHALGGADPTSVKPAEGN